MESLKRILSSKEDAIALAVLSALTIVLFIPIAFKPLGGDVAFYTLIGDRLHHGDTLYRDIWDLKPPGYYFLLWLGVSMFDGHFWCTAILSTILVWAGALGVFRLGEYYGGKFGAYTSAIVFLFAVYGVTVDGLGVQAETFAVPFIIWSYVLILNKPLSHPRAGLSGGLLAYAVCIKTSNLVYAIPWLMLGGFGLATVTAALSGLVVIGFFAIYLKLNGVLGEAKYTLTELGASFVSDRRRPFVEFIHEYKNQAGGLILVTVGCWVGAAFSFFERRMAALAVSVLLSLAVAFYQARYFIYHWIPLYQFGAIGLGALADARTSKPPKNLWLYALGLALVCLVPKYGTLSVNLQRFFSIATGRISYSEYAATFSTGYGVPALNEANIMQIAERIKNETRPEDYIFTNHFSPAVPFLAERRDAVRFIYFDGISIKHRRQAEWAQEYVDSVIARRPKIIVVCREFRQIFGVKSDLMNNIKDMPRLYKFFTENYVLEDKMFGSVELYQLKNSD